MNIQIIEIEHLTISTIMKTHTASYVIVEINTSKLFMHGYFLPKIHLHLTEQAFFQKFTNFFFYSSNKLIKFCFLKISKIRFWLE